MKKFNRVPSVWARKNYNKINNKLFRIIINKAQIYFFKSKKKIK